MNKFENAVFTGERALFSTHGVKISDCVFEDGESPLKESSELEITASRFSWKYPLWYCRGVRVFSSTLDVTARSGIWYTHGISMTECEISAPKTFRRSRDIALTRVNMPNALESMWKETIQNLGSISSVGMSRVDPMIVNIMQEKCNS